MLQRMLMSVIHIMFGNSQFCKIIINDYKSKCLYVRIALFTSFFHTGSLIGFLNSTSIVSKDA